jgi:hypothetical protein
MDLLRKLIDQRRQALPAGHKVAADAPVWGLALSGGGIRSATFCFGLLRALARQGVLSRIDLMSTVSGGGYIGAMLGRLFSRARDGQEGQKVVQAMAERNGNWFAWWLRANGRYLIPRGAKDTLFAMALYVRNMVGVHIELGLVFVLLGTLLALLDLGLWAGIDWLAHSGCGKSVFAFMQHVPSWLPPAGLLLAVPAFVAVVLATAYWAVPLLKKDKLVRLIVYVLLAVAVAVAAVAPALTAIPCFPVGSSVGREALWPLQAVLFAAPAAWVIGLAIAAYQLLTKNRHVSDLRWRADAVRSRLTVGLAHTFSAAAGIALAGAIDRGAWFLAFEFQAVQETGVALAIAATLARAVLPSLSHMAPGALSTRLLLMLGRLLGYAVTFLLCAWWVSLVYRLGLEPAFQRLRPAYGESALILAIAGGAALAYVLLTGRNLSFLNLSSLHAFYRARLVRSYLGAGNHQRFRLKNPLDVLGAVPPSSMAAASPDAQPIAVQDLHPDDDTPLEDYQPQRSGGPVHLINSCVNQTRDPRGGLFNQDRRGLMLTVASGGLMQVSRGGWQPLRGPAGLTLGAWTAISGAAVAPGLGHLTRGGISALLAFAGVRLGFWWDRETRGAARGHAWYEHKRYAPVKSAALLRETFGRFRGNEKPDWFITDGGHFENTGAYALLAERARVIVLADCGADPDYHFGDIEDLVRKARIDLGVRIEFQRPKSERPPKLAAFGSLSELASSECSACVGVARLHYDHGTPHETHGLLILVKPAICDGLPVDLQNFKGQNPQFPQQTTADQFFSEAQWESYFELGAFIGDKLDRGTIEQIDTRLDEWFEPDLPVTAAKDKSKGAQAADAGDGAPQRPAGALGRVPARLVRTATGATLGLGAVATLGISTWQALEGVKSAHTQRVDDERAALKELSGLWGSLTPPPHAPAGGASAPAEPGDKGTADKANTAPVAALATAIVRTAEALCPNGEHGWFVKSPVAANAYETAVQHCSLIPGNERPAACQMLLEGDYPGLHRPLPDCLAARQDKATRTRTPLRWYYDYSAQARPADAHPCDPQTLERSAAEARVAAPNFDYLLAPSAAPYAELATCERLTIPRKKADADNACFGKTVYTQAFGARAFEVALGYAIDWAKRTQAVVAPIEDLVANAKAEGRVGPYRIERTFIRHAASKEGSACAEALKSLIPGGAQLQPIHDTTVAHNEVEVWLVAADAASSGPTPAGDPKTAGSLPPPLPAGLLAPAAAKARAQVTLFTGPDRRKASDALVSAWNAATPAEREAIVGEIFQPLLAPQPAYRTALYAVYTLGRLKDWQPTQQQRDLLAELQQSPNASDPTFRDRLAAAIKSMKPVTPG